MLVTRVARVYAKALLDLALERGQLEEVKADMDHIGKLIKASREFELLLKSPVVKSDKKIAVFKEVFASKISELTLEFLQIVAGHGREGSLAAIVQSYTNQYQAHKGIAAAVVTTAIELREQELNGLREKLAGLTGKEIELENKVTADIIGGMILRVGDRQYNGSIAAELESLRREFKHNHYVADF